jgi:hypothetical protein
MKKLTILCLLISLNAFADLKIGVYEGNEKGSEQSCLLVVKEVTFKNDQKHPLNERVDILVSQSLTQFNLSHLPKLNLETGTIGPEKGILTDAIVKINYTEAVRLKLVHTAAYTGPVNYAYLKNTKEGEITNFHCENLKFID